MMGPDNRPGPAFHIITEGGQLRILAESSASQGIIFECAPYPHTSLDTASEPQKSPEPSCNLITTILYAFDQVARQGTIHPVSEESKEKPTTSGKIGLSHVVGQLLSDAFDAAFSIHLDSDISKVPQK